MCWATGNKLLIPYGGHLVVHQARDGEDWSGEMASWARDWRISRPRPAVDAAWWGLVPVPPSGLAAYAGFRPTAAVNVMAALARSERGRENHRRKLARDHAQRLDTRPDSASLAPRITLAGSSPQQSTTTPAEALPVPEPEAPPAQLSPTRPRLGWRRLLPRRWRR